MTPADHLFEAFSKIKIDNERYNRFLSKIRITKNRTCRTHK